MLYELDSKLYMNAIFPVKNWTSQPIDNFFVTSVTNTTIF
jgi:hypothetical protein